MRSMSTVINTALMTVDLRNGIENGTDDFGDDGFVLFS